jgi:hypothetical protein
LLEPGLPPTPGAAKHELWAGWHLVSENETFPNFALEEAYSRVFCIGVVTYRRYYMA